ncbi:hypothetical protein BDQ17DRAFT_1281274 [Cyathus striatus]|nr:hypothetical protein BDQ17DRAFT_1281274 [Cyathus striatus]
MSHQVRLTLRPPPNVDFVHGYPGIPPGADRPQAAVKGAIEIRVPPQGVRAKWVRIELRKVETLPGGGTTNTFYDYVGPTPLNLWQAPEGDYGMLRTGDFQFSIRIPESIPPSIALENRAGINYELVASVCVKGKKGFFRRSKSSVVSTTSQILIDKHELHSTWPIYTQPESRTLTTPEGVTLLVDRRSACFGPGDRIAVSATIKSDALHTIILRGFELILKESSVFRPGPFAQGKKSAPQAKVVVVSEAKFAVNATIYGGMGHKSDLSCGLSADHTTTTLNAARHIDVTYTIVVRALMGTGQPVVMELPVIVSNWQRHVSLEAVRRIGPSPGLSLLPPQHSGHANGAITRVDPLPRGGGTLPTSRQQPVLDVRSATVGVSSPMSMNKSLPADEFGYGVGYPSTNNTINTNNNTGVNGNANNTTLTKVKTHQSTGSRSSTEDYRSGVGGGSGMGGGGGVGTTPGKGGRPTSSRSNTQQQHRFTITNLGNGEIPEDVNGR